MTVMMSRRYGADTDTVDDDVWYMLIDSAADAVRVDVMQADQLSTLRYLHDDFTAVQSSTGQPRHDLLCACVTCVQFHVFYANKSKFLNFLPTSTWSRYGEI